MRMQIDQKAQNRQKRTGDRLSADKDSHRKGNERMINLFSDSDLSSELEQFVQEIKYQFSETDFLTLIYGGMVLLT